MKFLGTMVSLGHPEFPDLHTPQREREGENHLNFIFLFHLKQPSAVISKESELELSLKSMRQHG